MRVLLLVAISCVFFLWGKRFKVWSIPSTSTTFCCMREANALIRLDGYTYSSKTWLFAFKKSDYIS